MNSSEPHRASARQPFQRDRHGHTRVTNEELFFDLIYAFAVTQLSHRLLEHLDAITAVQTLVMWFGVWLGWQYTSWVTNWFNPEHRGMRGMLFALMLLGLVMSSAIPDAFGERGLVFGLAYATIQVGRTLFVLLNLERDDPLRANFTRIFGWLCISAVLWVSGAFADASLRLGLWAAAVLCEYASPMFGFWLPGLGRSNPSSEWTIDGAHLAERCQLFVIVALGESILASGAGFSQSAHWDLPTAGALAVAFAGSLAMWWVYFDIGSRDGTAAIVESDDPGRIGSYFHYVHVTLIAGLIVAAVGDELMIHHPHEHVDLAPASVMVGGPLIYLAGNAAYKKVVYGALPLSHLVGMAALLALCPLALHTDRLVAGALTSGVMIVVAVWQSRHPRRRPSAARAAA